MTTAVATKPAPAASPPAPAAAAPAAPVVPAAAAPAADPPKTEPKPTGDPPAAPAEGAATPEGGAPAPATDGNDGDGDDAAAQAAAVVPETEDGYELAVPDLGIKDNAGNPVEAKIDANDPAARSFRAWAHKHKLPQGAVNALMTEVYAPMVKAQIDAQREGVTVRQAQGWADLGEGDVEKGKDYGKRVFNAALATFGDDKTHDHGLLEAMQTPGAVKAIDALLQLINGDGASRDLNRGGDTETKQERRARLFYGQKDKK